MVRAGRAKSVRGGEKSTIAMVPTSTASPAIWMESTIGNSHFESWIAFAAGVLPSHRKKLQQIHSGNLDIEII